MASSVSGKIAFVTGGASGIGAALTTRLVDGGAEVWIADRQIGPAQELAQRLNSGGAKAHAIELDVRDYPSFERAVAEAVQQSGRIDYLFNNAGIGVGGEVDSYTLDDWNDVFDVNLRGVVHGIQAVYPIMIRQQSGHIVNTASMAGLVTAAGQANYTASKHAVVAISKTLRVEAERHGVKVSVLCPGVVRTPILTGGKYGRISSQRQRSGGHQEILGAVPADGTRKVRRPRPSRRVPGRRNHCGASLVEGMVVPGTPLAGLIDAGCKTRAQALTWNGIHHLLIAACPMVRRTGSNVAWGGTVGNPAAGHIHFDVATFGKFEGNCLMVVPTL